MKSKLSISLMAALCLLSAMTYGQQKVSYNTIESGIAEDPYTVKFNLKKDFPAVTPDQVTIDLDDYMTETGDTNVLNIKIKENANSGRRNKFAFAFNFGVNSLLENKTISGYNYPDFDLWKSWFFDAGFFLRTKIGKPSTTPFSIKYGIQFSSNNFNYKGNYTLAKRAGDYAPYFENLQVNGLSKSKFGNNYISIPVALELNFRKKTSIDNGDRIEFGHRTFSLMAGGYIGLRTSTYDTHEYKDIEGDDLTVKTNNNFGMNNVVYGVMAHIGYGHLTLYAKYDLSNLIRKTDVLDYNVLSTGLSFNF